MNTSFPAVINLVAVAAVNHKYAVLRLVVFCLLGFAFSMLQAAEQPRNGGHAAANFAVALVGDTPYGELMESAFDDVIEDINQDPDIALVIHVGDIKSGGEPCDNALLQRRHTQLQRFEPPLIYTPGDNEWTDCHRRSNGAYSPLERLAFIRKLFFDGQGGDDHAELPGLQSQRSMPAHSDYVENTLFTKENVLFLQLHVVGSNNNLDPWQGIDSSDSTLRPRQDRLQEFEQREQAALAWLDHGFELARAQGRAAVVVSMHANPRFELSLASQQRAGFKRVIASLQDQVKAFDKLVLLVHGDRHFFIHDQPLDDVPRLTRVQTFGHMLNHWIKLEISPATPAVFSIEPRL